MRSPLSNCRPLGFESLERRKVMAGNVMGSVSNGLLTLTGDYQGNALVAYNGAGAGQVVIAGAKDYAGGNTLVNNSAAPVTFDAVSRIQLDMRSGNDRVLFTNLTLPVPGPYQRSIYGLMGAGNDQVAISGGTGTPRAFALNQGGPIPYGTVNIAGTAFIDGNAGNDVLSIANATLGGGVQRDGSQFRSGFDGGTGDDQFLVDGSLAQNHVGSLNVKLGADHNTVSLKRANINGNLDIDGVDLKIDLYKLRISGNVLITNYPAGAANITIDSDATPGNEFTVTGYLFIYTGSAPANIALRHAKIGSATISTGVSSDHVEISDSVFSQLGPSGYALNLGLAEENDYLSLKNVTAQFDAFMSGGDGTDTYNDLGGNTMSGANVISFES